MKQLLSRLKKRAATQGRSLNDLVVSALSAEIHQSFTPDMVRERARATGKLYLPDAPQQLPTPTELASATRGTGRAISDALEADRDAQ